MSDKRTKPDQDPVEGAPDIIDRQLEKASPSHPKGKEPPGNKPTSDPKRSGRPS